MIKEDELADPNSCLNRARPGELLFVLLERDEDTPDTIRYGVSRRIARGKNRPDDLQMVSALECASQMERNRANNKIRGK